MNVSILGWYGHRNLGDEAILEGFQYLFHNHRFTVLSDKMPLQEIFWKANQSDLFILGGGELINSTRLFSFPAHWDDYLTVPKMVLGCGVNAPNIESIQPHVLESLESFEYIGLRDLESCRILRSDPKLSSKIHLFLDPAITLAKKHGLEHCPESENTAVIVPTDRFRTEHDEGILHTDYVNQSLPQLKKDLEQDKIENVVLVPFGGDDNDDMESCRQIAHSLSDRLYVSTKCPETPRETLEIMAACSKAYTYRLHGMLFAYSLKMPFNCYEYHRKIRKVYEMLKGYENELPSL